MKRQLLSLILVFAMTVSLLTVGTGAVEPTYGDTAGHWAESSIERWSAYGIIQGSNGQFDPNGQLTCAQLATILAKLLKLPAAKDAGFTDNTADAWYYDAINRCAAAGILNGNGDGTVTPEAPITRERAMVMLARALGIEPIRKPDLTKYTDAAQVSAYAQGYVAALIEAGIVGGVTADELAPQANINRASVIAGYSLGLNFGLAIPWVPVTNNVLCASYFGTDVSAGGLLGLFVSIVFIVVGMLYIKWYEKRLAAAGKGYAPAYGTGALEENNDLDEDAKKGPHWILSVIPMLIPIIVLNIFKIRVEFALLCGVAAVIILQFKYLPRDWDANRKTVTDSISMCMTTLINAAAIVGFGAVVQNCPGYAIAVEKILSYEGSPLMITFVATNLIAGIAGSSSAGLVLAAPVLQQAAAMTNAAVFHRTTVLASLGLDSLPNAGFLQTECTVAGVKFKDVYFPVIFALTVVLTILRCLLYMGLAAAFGLT